MLLHAELNHSLPGLKLIKILHNGKRNKPFLYFMNEIEAYFLTIRNVSLFFPSDVFFKCLFFLFFFSFSYSVQLSGKIMLEKGEMSTKEKRKEENPIAVDKIYVH